MPSSRATAVTVFPEESTRAIASRLNSSVYRFVYLFPTWCYFLWNLMSHVSRCPRSRGSFTRRLVRDYERLVQHSEALINWSAITLMTRRLTRKPARRSRPTTPIPLHWDELAA